MSAFTDFLSGIGPALGLLGGGAAAKGAYDRLGDIGDVAQQGAMQIAQQGIDQSQFQPFSVTSATGGQFGYDPTTGAATMGLSPQEQAIQSMLMGQAQSTLGATPYGQAGGRAAAQQAYGLGNQFMQSSQTQPADINQLRGQFASQVSGQLGQQPSAAIGQLGQQALGLGSQGLGQQATDVTQTFSGINAPGLRDVSQAYSGLQAPGVRTAAGDLASRSLGLGMAGLDTQAPTDAETLRSQYASLASQSAGNVLGSMAGREADVYERIRATQRPEEERQRMALEERLFNQGRLGVSTNMYGGTPEQLAMAKAQEEAQNSASLGAIQQAQSERQQALGEAQTLGGMFSQQAGLSSNLQNQAQSRAAQLSQLGLGAEQVQAQLESEGFGRAFNLAGANMQSQQAQAQLEAQRMGQQLQLGQSNIAAQQAQSGLQNQAQTRAAQLSQLGLSANQIQSQLQSEGLGRAATSASQASQLAQLAGGLQAQQAGLGAQMAGLGSQLSAQDMAMLSGQQQLGLGALGGSYIPQAQLLAAMQGSELYPQLQQKGQLYGAGLFGEGAMGGLEALLGAGLGQANLMGQLGTGLISGLSTPTDNFGGLSEIFGGGASAIGGLLGGLLGSGDVSDAFGEGANVNNNPYYTGDF